MFSKLNSKDNTVELVYGTVIETKYEGTIEVFSDDADDWIQLKNKLFLPDLSLSLISIPKIDIKRINAIFANEKCTLRDSITNEVITYAYGENMSDGLYTMKAEVKKDKKVNVKTHVATGTI